jgi:hypothetical protein
MDRRNFLAVAPLAAAPLLTARESARAAELSDPSHPWTDLRVAIVTELGRVRSSNIRLVNTGAGRILSFGNAPSGVTKTLRSAALTTLYCGFPDPDGLGGRPGVKIVGNQPAGGLTPNGLSGRLVLDDGDVVVVTSLGGGVWEVLEHHANSIESYLLMPGVGEEDWRPPVTLKTWGKIGKGDQPYYPFAIDPRSGKAFSGGMFLRDWGDTPELGFDVGAKGPDGSPVPVTQAPYPGGYIYSRAGVPDGKGGLRFIDSQKDFPGASPPYLYLGRPCQLEFPVTEPPTAKGAGGGFTVCVTRHGTATPIQRSWWSHTGNFVAAGKATFEAAGIGYPYNVRDLGLARKHYAWAAPSGDCNYFETPGWGNVTIICTDIGSKALDHNAGVAMRKFGEHGSGVDFGYDFDTDRWAAFRVHDHVRAPSLAIAPKTGDITLGDRPEGRHTVNGIVSTPDNPAFQAVLRRDLNNATGDGGDLTVPFDATAFNRSGGFDAATGAFVAPVDGLYQLQTTVQLAGLGRHKRMLVEIVTAAQVHALAPGAPSPDDRGRAGVCLHALAAMRAGDAARVRVTVDGGERTVGVLAGSAGAPASTFSGFLAG